MISSIGRYISGSITEEGRYNSALMDETGVFGLSGIPKITITPVLFAPSSSPWQENIPASSLSPEMFTPNNGICNTINSTTINSNTFAPSYRYVQQIPFGGTLSIDGPFAPSFNCTYIPPHISITPTVFSVKASPYQDHVPLKTILSTLFLPFTNPFQQNVGLATIVPEIFNPTCYRPPIITPKANATWTLTPIPRKRFTRIEV